MQANHARSQPSLSRNLVEETNVLVDACNCPLYAIAISDLIGKHVPQTDLAQRCAHPAGVFEQGTVKAPPEVLEYVEEVMRYTPSADASRVHRVQVHMRVEQPREQRHTGGVNLLSSCNRPCNIQWKVPRGQART